MPLASGAKAVLVAVHKAARRHEMYRGDELLEAYAVSLGRDHAKRVCEIHIAGFPSREARTIVFLTKSR
jgi:hypothetical protein